MGYPDIFVLGYSNHIKDKAVKISCQRCKPGSCFLRKEIVFVGTTGDGSARIVTIAPSTPIRSHYDGEGRLSASLVDPDSVGWFGSWLMLCSGGDGSLVCCLVGILGNQLVTQAAWGQQIEYWSRAAPCGFPKSSLGALTKGGSLCASCKNT